MRMSSTKQCIPGLVQSLLIHLCSLESVHFLLSFSQFDILVGVQMYVLSLAGIEYAQHYNGSKQVTHKHTHTHVYI